MRYDSLNQPPPLWRTHDPETSKVAARKVVASGTANDHRTRIVAAIREAPGSTPREIAEATGLGYHAVQRRLKEAQIARLIEPRGERDGMRVWFPVPQEGNG